MSGIIFLSSVQQWSKKHYHRHDRVTSLFIKWAFMPEWIFMADQQQIPKSQTRTTKSASLLCLLFFCFFSIHSLVSTLHIALHWEGTGTTTYQELINIYFGAAVCIEGGKKTKTHEQIYSSNKTSAVVHFSYRTPTDLLDTLKLDFDILVCRW